MLGTCIEEAVSECWGRLLALANVFDVIGRWRAKDTMRRRFTPTRVNVRLCPRAM